MQAVLYRSMNPIRGFFRLSFTIFRLEAGYRPPGYLKGGQ